MRPVGALLLLALLAGCRDDTVVGDNTAAANAGTAPEGKRRAREAFIGSHSGGDRKGDR